MDGQAWEPVVLDKVRRRPRQMPHVRPRISRVRPVRTHAQRGRRAPGESKDAALSRAMRTGAAVAEKKCG